MRDRPSGMLDRIAMAYATLLGVGYAPFASGTWGSLATLPLAWLLARPGSVWLFAGATAVLSLLAFPAATVAERILGKKDASPVVADEMAGMLVTLVGVPFGLPSWTAGFLLFRFFDIAKLYPANRVERLRGGLGIVGDDLIAGVYANLTLQIGLRLWKAWS